ncbi:hypothetical protein ACLK18_12740 [Escherichia coli]
MITISPSSTKTLPSGQNHHSLSATHAAAQGHSLTDIAGDSHFISPRCFTGIVTDSAAILFNFRRMGIVIIIEIRMLV